MARSLLDDLVTTFFPAPCRACDRPLTRAGLVPVCDDCLANLHPQTTALCRRCGHALEMDMESSRQLPTEGLLCTTCRLVPPPFERAVAFGVHEHTLRELVHLLKYERMPTLAKPLGAVLASQINALGLTDAVMVIAVPLHAARERERGYNQSVLLANAAARALEGQSGLRMALGHGLLRRTRATESQLSLTARKRRKNVRGAFAVEDAAAVAGQTIVLVDDVYTTGATAQECARVLHKAGAARVFVATVTRAQPEAERFDLAFWGGATTGNERSGFENRRV